MNKDNEIFDFLEDEPKVRHNSWKKMKIEQAVKQLVSYKKQSVEEKKLSLMEEFEDHLKNYIGTLENFPKKDQLLKYAEEHPDELNVEEIKAISAKKMNNFHEALFQQIFVTPNKSYFFNAPLIKAFENIMNGKPTDFQEPKIEDSGNFIIQNYRDEVENSNILNPLPKKPLEVLLKDEENNKAISTEKYSEDL